MLASCAAVLLGAASAELVWVKNLIVCSCVSFEGLRCLIFSALLQLRKLEIVPILPIFRDSARARSYALWMLRPNSVALESLAILSSRLAGVGQNPVQLRLRCCIRLVDCEQTHSQANAPACKLAAPIHGRSFAGRAPKYIHPYKERQG